MTDEALHRLLSPELQDDEVDQALLERATLRPQKLDDFTGQQQIRENLKIFIQAAKHRGDPLDHVLLYGPPGLGKTTLANIIALEMGVGFRATSGPVITRAGDLAALLTNLQPRDVLFIDEIHRLNPAVEEILYPAMEDFKLDLMIGEGPAARSVQIDLPPFTLIGATTRSGLVTRPLRERFGIPLALDFYTVEELQGIISRAAHLLSLKLTPAAAAEIGCRSRSTPRVAMRLLRRIRDIVTVAKIAHIDTPQIKQALHQLNIDDNGLDALDRKYLKSIAEKYDGGPVGVETMAAVLGEQKDVIEEVIEPFLMQQGFIQRTPRGRTLTRTAYAYLGLESKA